MSDEGAEAVMTAIFLEKGLVPEISRVRDPFDELVAGSLSISASSRSN